MPFELRDTDQKTIYKQEPNGHSPFGRLAIRKRGSVSWKATDNGNQSLKFGLANSNGMCITLDEFYKNDQDRIIARKTMIEINPDEAQAIVDHLQRWLHTR